MVSHQESHFKDIVLCDTIAADIYVIIDVDRRWRISVTAEIVLGRSGEINCKLLVCGVMAREPATGVGYTINRQFERTGPNVRTDLR